MIVAYGLIQGDWFEGAIAGITLAIGLLPEEFPMVLAIFLALGAFRLARRNVLVRRSSVTETLGSTSLLCVDKTGTLTENRMAVVALYTGGPIEPAPDAPDAAQHRLILAALRASSENPVDPMDRAVHGLAERLEIPAGGAATESFPDQARTAGLHTDMASRRRRAEGGEGRAGSDPAPCRRQRRSEGAAITPSSRKWRARGCAFSPSPRRSRSQASPNRRLTFCAAS